MLDIQPQTVGAPCPSHDVADAAGTAARTPWFSVVVPLHNKAGYVRVALESVLAQTLGDFEVVVVDDGSTDNGARIVRQFADPRVRLVHQENAGVSAARNRAIALCRGEWVTFLDADDWYHPDYLATLRQLQQAHPDVDAVATRFVEFKDAYGSAPADWRPETTHAGVERIRDLPSRWMQGPTLFTGSISVRRSLLLHMQPCFPPGESMGEDLDLWFRVAEQTDIAMLDCALVGYRAQVTGSLTHEKLPHELPPFIERMHQRALSGSLRPELARSTLAYIALVKVELARNALLAGERRRCIRWLLEGMRAASSKRWWLTAVMAFSWPAPLVRSYVVRARRRGLQVA
jgi:glycosyltransferase involved in cell wall biosynthesis